MGATVLGLIGQSFMFSYQAEQTQRSASVTKFVEVSQQFDRNVSDFMGPFLQGVDSEAQREALRKNIQDQFLALEQAEGVLPESEESRAKAYRDALVEVDAQLGRNDPAPKARGLVQAIADAREANVCVTYFMKDEVGLSVSSNDAEYCADGRKPQLRPL
ncbi:hypothetical protein [Croceicoccus ponticola]|uniref:hypothetical protein n=1 Tax=Croceicoccus ponticola TaxID=2217664 RepID=UPI00196AF5B2|nr:hypothetical protein [Croceicoccus ponticola]